MFAQSNLNGTVNSFEKALSESFGWYDIPVSSVWLSSKVFQLKLQHKIDVDIFSIDNNIHSKISTPGYQSLGSTDPRRYPEAVFLARMAITTAAGLLYGADTYNSYKHNMVFMKAVIYNYVITEFIKNITHRVRPDNSDDRSFFSGHTSTAFVTSAFLYQETIEYLDRSVKNRTLNTSLQATSFALLYGWAGYVGYSRIKDNKHYFSDVVTGAAVGTFIGIFMHNLYFDNSDITNNFSLGMYNNQPALHFRYNFD